MILTAKSGLREVARGRARELEGGSRKDGAEGGSFRDGAGGSEMFVCLKTPHGSWRVPK